MKSAVINENTKISELIKANPRVIETLAEFNQHFNKLKNPVLRHLLARRVSISDACRIGGCAPGDFLDKMASIGFEIEGSTDPWSVPGSDYLRASDFAAGLKVVELDVRPVLAQGDDPLKLIMEASRDLKTDECLKVINTFEPLPLIILLGKQGYRSWTERSDADTVFTWFVRNEHKEAIPDLSTTIQGLADTDPEFQNMVGLFAPEKLHTIDVRELKMPLPMLTILEYLPELKADEALFVYHKKVPVYLLPELAERGFRYFIQNSPDGNINMLICRS